VTYVTTAAKPTGGKVKKGGDIMDSRELGPAKKQLEDKVGKEFIEFEKKSGMAIKGLKIKRVDSAAMCPDIDYIIIKVEIPDMD